jgi:orotidine-5'-phosphate decarboxylase
MPNLNYPSASWMHADVRDRLIVALDTPTVQDAQKLVTQLGDAVSFYKIGYRLAFSGGLTLAQDLVASGKHVFLDLKLHDLGNTVREGVQSLAGLGMTFLTVHAYPQTMRAAMEGRGTSSLRLLAVTALTSYDDKDAEEAGYRLAVRDLVRLRAQQASGIGMDGIVCSAAETAVVRERVGAHVAIVTPGIRPQNADQGDQKRTLSPEEAMRAGVNYLVIGRPIVQAENPRTAAQSILESMRRAV